VNGVTEPLIPKTIHYCWFGSASLPKLAIKCIKSWERHLPDYEIIRWDERNFDININRYVREAYRSGKYAFVSDVARLHALFNSGGIYMDVDVEVIKNLDKFLCHKAFTGFEDPVSIPTGIMASIRQHDLFKELLDYYDDKIFIRDDGSYDTTTNVSIITNLLLRYGLKSDNTLQEVNNLVIYPRTFFCPLNCNDSKSFFSNETHTIHHFAGSWLTRRQRRLARSIFWEYYYNIHDTIFR
jgi:mannosyltransferase OCH1-like enzyme